jgi:hypothetical protein
MKSYGIPCHAGVVPPVSVTATVNFKYDWDGSHHCERMPLGTSNDKIVLGRYRALLLVGVQVYTELTEATAFDLTFGKDNDLGKDMCARLLRKRRDFIQC